MDSIRWLWTPSEVMTMAHVTVFYTIICSRFAPEWAALVCMALA